MFKSKILAISTISSVFITQNSDENNSPVLQKRLEDNIEQWNAKSKAAYKLSLSFGFAEYSSSDPCSVEELINKADDLMYEQKVEHKKQQKAPES